MNLAKTKVMVRKIGQISIKSYSKEDPCGICGRKTMANVVLCKSCRNRMHGRCANIKRVTKTQRRECPRRGYGTLPW